MILYLADDYSGHLFTFVLYVILVPITTREKAGATTPQQPRQQRAQETAKINPLSTRISLSFFTTQKQLLSRDK